MSADPRIADALAALQTAREATKDPEARAAVDRAFKLLRDMPREHDMVANGFRVPSVGPQPLTMSYGFDIQGRLGATSGISVAPLSEALAEQLQLPAGTGLLLTAVRPDSSFAKAGAKRYDVVIKIDGVSVTGGESDLTRRFAATKPGSTVVVTVLRKGAEKALDVTLPQPKVELARPASKKVRFESKSVSVTNDTFSIDAKAGEVQYKITGKLDGGKIESYEAKIYEGKDVTVLVQTGDGINLAKTGEKYRPAVQTLLDSVRGN